MSVEQSIEKERQQDLISAQRKPQNQFQLGDLKGPEKALVVKIDNFLSTQKPKKIISHEICIEQQFPFWIKKELCNPETEIKAEEFLIDGEIKDSARIQFLKQGEPLQSDQSIIRKVTPQHRITPIPSKDHCLLMALRACRQQHYLLWKNDIQIIQEETQIWKENFLKYFGITNIDEDFGNKTNDLLIYAQVFNCIIYQHEDIFPDPKALKFEPSWKASSSYYTDRKGQLKLRQPWICHILKIDDAIFAIQLKDFKDAKKLDYTLQKKIYYVPISYRKECIRWIEEYKTYKIRMDGCIEYFDKEKILSEETTQALFQLQPVVYFKKSERNKIKTRMIKLQQKLIKLGFEKQVHMLPDFLLLRKFYYLVQNPDILTNLKEKYENISNNQKQFEESIVNLDERKELNEQTEQQLQIHQHQISGSPSETLQEKSSEEFQEL